MNKILIEMTHQINENLEYLHDFKTLLNSVFYKF
jgi:hypothetical protein